MRFCVGAAAVGLLSVTTGCGPAPGFECSSDEQCRSPSGQLGTCFSVGACGYDDASCPSGFRFSRYAPKPWTNACVMPEASSSSSSSGAPLESSSGDELSTTGGPMPTTSGPPQPFCGDGVIDEDEQCDDGNDEIADGCNPDCVRSGEVVWSVALEERGEQEAHALVVTLDGHVVVGGHTGAPGQRDGVITYLEADEGEPTEAWQKTFAGEADDDDTVWDLALDSRGRVLVLAEIVEPGILMGFPAADYHLAEFSLPGGEPSWAQTFGTQEPIADQARAMLLRNDGTVVLAGHVGLANAGDFSVEGYRVDLSGSEPNLEELWSNTFTGANGAFDTAYAVAQDGANRFIIGGIRTRGGGDIDRYLVALGPEGDPFTEPCEDPGSRKQDGPDGINALTVGPDGTVFAAGYTTLPDRAHTDAWIGTYPPGACTLDTGEPLLNPNGVDSTFNAIALDSAGNVVVGGVWGTDEGAQAWVAKFNSGGLRWSIDGTGPLDGASRVNAMALSEDGTLTVAGRKGSEDAADVWVARITP